MECDNNNDCDIASEKALDNSLCSEVCVPGEWPNAGLRLGGRQPPARPLSCSPSGTVSCCLDLTRRPSVSPDMQTGALSHCSGLLARSDPYCEGTGRERKEKSLHLAFHVLRELALLSDGLARE